MPTREQYTYTNRWGSWPCNPLNALHAELEEEDRKQRSRIGITGWIRCTVRFLIHIYYPYRYMRGYLRVAKQLLSLAKWQLHLGTIHRAELLRRISDFEYDAEREFPRVGQTVDNDSQDEVHSNISMEGSQRDTRGLGPR